MRTFTYLGFALGLAVVALAVWAGGGDGAVLAHGAAWLVVLAGTLAAAVLSSSPLTLRHTLAALSRLLLAGGLSTRKVAAAMVELARRARADGPGAIDPEAVAPRDPFLVKGLQLVVEQAAPERIEELLRDESERLSARRLQAAELLGLMGRAAALVGGGASLLALLQLTPGWAGVLAPWAAVAGALPAAAYGLLLAGLLFLPPAARVRTLDRYERLVRDQVIRGLLGIRLGQNLEYLREALAGYGRKHG